MKKFFIAIFLLLIIFFSFSFIILKLLANGAEDNFFNQKYRAQVAAHPVLRNIFDLRFDGDARADYLSSRYNKIFIEVDQMEGLEISQSALDLLETKIESITSKEVIIFRSDSIPYQANVDGEDVKQYVEAHRNYKYASDVAHLYLLYLSEFEDQADHLGSTYQEYGILLYDTALRNLTIGNPKTFDNYWSSTALHEFGHQLGLPHNEIKGCLMNEHAESGQVLRENPEDVIIDFCAYEKQLIVL